MPLGSGNSALILAENHHKPKLFQTDIRTAKMANNDLRMEKIFVEKDDVDWRIGDQVMDKKGHPTAATTPKSL